MFWDWWQNLFVDMSSINFFNFSFLPRYGYAVIQGVEYTLILSVISVLLAVLPALMLAMMRISRHKTVRCLSGAYIAAFRSTPILVQLMIILRSFFCYKSTEVSDFWFYRLNQIHTGSGGAGT